MKRGIIIVLVFFTLTPCYGQDFVEDSLIKYPLESISYICQSSPEDMMSKITFEYDNQHRLLRTTHRETTVEYAYNDLGLLSSKHSIHQRNTNKYEDTLIYKYDNKNRLIFEGFDVEKSYKSYYTYSEQGKVIEKLWTWNDKKIPYTYEYDEYGRLIAEYKNDKLLYTLEYSDKRLIKKTQYFRYTSPETKYEYDEYGNLIYKKEEGKVLEHNIYENNQLIERWQYYFGADPCYDPCCSQYIMRLTYYEE